MFIMQVGRVRDFYYGFWEYYLVCIVYYCYLNQFY